MKNVFISAQFFFSLFQASVPDPTVAVGKQELVSPSKKNLASISMYQSPYQGRSGGGYPIFTEERILDRKFKVRYILGNLGFTYLLSVEDKFNC